MKAPRDLIHVDPDQLDEYVTRRLNKQAKAKKRPSYTPRASDKRRRA